MGARLAPWGMAKSDRKAGLALSFPPSDPTVELRDQGAGYTVWAGEYGY